MQKKTKTRAAANQIERGGGGWGLLSEISPDDDKQTGGGGGGGRGAYITFNDNDDRQRCECNFVMH